MTGLASGVAAITTGGNHSCALMKSGGVKCWGDNANGVLGNGTTVDSHVPIDVSGLTSGVQAIDAGSHHSCALMVAGGVKCWGYNLNGQLGDGSREVLSRIPVDVSGLAGGVVAISAGGGHTLAMMTDGSVKAWGCNCLGQVGDGSTVDRDLPVDVKGLTSSASAITAGDGHSCALTVEGGVLCWGDSGGKLGNATINANFSVTPVTVDGLATGAIAVAAGGIGTCALTSAGGVLCWGDNTYGGIGNGTFTSSNSPADVAGLQSGIATIALGQHHVCAVTTGGGILCWGDNQYGQLGNGTNSGGGPVNGVNVPVAVLKL